MSDEEEAKRPIIIRRKKIIAAGHHGGAWKVAYADFVTAMMAFFLLMWLISSTTEQQRDGLANYFNPKIPISETSGGGDSMLSGDSVYSENTLAQNDTGGRDQNVTDFERQRELLEKEKMNELGAEVIKQVEAMDPKEFEELTGTDELLEHMRLSVTDEGLRIELVDINGTPLFASGSTEPTELFIALIEVVSRVIKTVDNPLRISGHTDAKQFAPGSAYTNWELSADRANVARALIKGYNILPARFVGVEGLADTKPLSEDPFAPENRRISILLLKNSIQN